MTNKKRMTNSTDEAKTDMSESAVRINLDYAIQLIDEDDALMVKANKEPDFFNEIFSLLLITLDKSYFKIATNNKQTTPSRKTTQLLNIENSHIPDNTRVLVGNVEIDGCVIGAILNGCFDQKSLGQVSAAASMTNATPSQMLRTHVGYNIIPECKNVVVRRLIYIAARLKIIPNIPMDAPQQVNYQQIR